MRKYYDLKREYDELNQFKTSITHMVSPSKDKSKPCINSSSISSISTNLSKFASPEVRKISSVLSDYNVDFDSNAYTPHSSSDRDFDPIMTTSQQRNKYGSDSPIIFHNKTPQKSRDQPLRSRSATLSTRKKTSILKDPSSLTREKNVKFSPNTKDCLEEKEISDTSFSAPPTPHSSFGVQYSKKSDLVAKEETSDRFVSTPSRRSIPNQESSNKLSTSKTITSNDFEEIGNDVSAQELYLRVKKALSPEEFKHFSTNIRKLNMGEQSITTTLVNLRDIIGEERQKLYAHLKRVISSGEM